MNNPGVLLYKCRKCGKIFEGNHVPDVSLTVILISINMNMNKPSYELTEPFKELTWLKDVYNKSIEVHHCDMRKGRIGIADIIGGEEDKENKKDSGLHLLPESRIKKGGLNAPPISPRPSNPPSGQHNIK